MMSKERGFLVLATVVFTLGLVLGSFVNPLFRIPDERFHADMIQVAGEVDDLVREGWPLVGDRGLGDAVMGASQVHGTRTSRTVAAAVPRDQRPALDAMTAPSDQHPSNRMSQHPPLYYVTVKAGTEVLEALEPGASAYDVELWFMRFANILLLMPLPLLALLTAKRLGGGRDIVRAAAIAPLMVPGLVIRNGPILNNDNLLTVLGAAVAYVVVRVVTGDDGRRTAVLGGIACGLAMLTKAFGLFMLVALGLAYSLLLLQRIRGPGALRPVLLHGVLAVIVAFVSGGWWYVRTYVRAGTVLERGFPRPDVEGFVPDWGHWILQIVPRSWKSFWGGNFVLNPRDHDQVLTALLVLTLVSVVTALWRSPARWRLLASMLPLIVLAGVIYANQAHNYAARGRIAFQGRYLYGGLTGLTTVMVFGMAALLGRLRSGLPLLTTVLAGGLYTIGFHSFLEREWGGAGLRSSTGAMLAWSGPAPWLVVVTWIAFATAGLFLAWTVRPLPRAGWSCKVDAEASVGVLAATVEPNQEVGQQPRHDDLQRDDREDDGV